MKKKYFLIKAKSVPTSITSKINNPMGGYPYDLTLKVVSFWGLINRVIEKRVYLKNNSIENVKPGREIIL